jgi:hypothetical protein
MSSGEFICCVMYALTTGSMAVVISVVVEEKAHSRWLRMSWALSSNSLFMTVFFLHIPAGNTHVVVVWLFQSVCKRSSFPIDIDRSSVTQSVSGTGFPVECQQMLARTGNG